VAGGGDRKGLEFGILGPVVALRDGVDLDLGGQKPRALLAVLLLHANEVVSQDALIDQIWGTEPPATAAKTLHAHVSRLRRALREEVGPEGSEASLLQTRGHGYLLGVEPGQLDAAAFTELVATARGSLARGDAAQAADGLRDALGLWRGPALADLVYEPFAQPHVARLEEQRAAALEDRIEADLALGRHAELIGELEERVGREPLRERLRGQLMVALYRSGRQAEALETFAQGRRVLAAELGLDPSGTLQQLERQILAQDPALDPPAGATPSRRVPPPTVGRERRSPWVWALAGAALIAAAGIAAALELRGDDGPSPTVTAEGQAVALDAETGEIERRVPVGRTPAAIAASDDAVWLVDADARTLVRFDAEGNTVETLATGSTPTDVVVGRGAVWVANGGPLPAAQFIGPVATAVTRVDPATRTERARVELPPPRGAVSNLVENHLAVHRGAIWAVTPDFSLARIDTETGAITVTTRPFRAVAVAAGGAGVWALGIDGDLARLEPRSGRVLGRVRVPVASLGAIAVGDDSAWVTSPGDGVVWRARAARRGALTPIQLEQGITDVAVAGPWVWVVNPLRGAVTQLDARRGAVVRRIELGGTPRAVAVDGSRVWVAAAAGPTTELSSEVNGVRTFSSSRCEPAVAGTDDADLLVVSDLPLQGGINISVPQMAQAITFVLRERNFRAGRFRVAYQSCDDSIATTGLYDEAKCEANARAYVSNEDVLGVIGPVNSPCAVAALPTLNAGPDGPLAIVSPLNDFVGLTRPGVGVDPALPGALYPTGRRNYLRVYPAGDLQGAALALLARELGERRVFVLDDGEPGYGALMAEAFETASRRLGLTVLGRATWDPRRSEFRELASRVAARRPTAVFVGGLLDTGAGKIVRSLRARLGPSVTLLGPDGLTPLPSLVDQAGEAATGMYVSLSGLLTERLPPAGEAFAERFGRTQAGTGVEPAAVYAAQAAEVLIDAIARSDGTRASVLRELFRTRVRDGLLGSFRFDRNGDISESPVTIMRVVRKGSSTRTLSVEGGVVARVVRPSSSLVAPGP